jgi:predicted metal-dependent hydrolase
VDQLPLPLPKPPARSRQGLVVAGRKTFLVDYVRVRRARHYIIRIQDDGRLRVTVPWSGSRREAERFVRERLDWIERERFRQLTRPRTPGRWAAGSAVLLDGEAWPLEVEPAPGAAILLRFGHHTLRLPAGAAAGDLRPHVERYLRACATRDLPARLRELAREHGFAVTTVSIRNQRSRWGACSPKGGITLNWRLVQMPPHVRDYVLLHELVHLKHLNHSRRFWREVERLCPRCHEARAWLRGQRLTE